MPAQDSSPPPALPERAVFFSVPDLARALGWTVQRTRRWLRRHDALEMHGRRGRTTRELLRQAFPRTYAEVVAAAEDARTPDDD